ncbi:MAG TPA: (2Fe-2S)-binding protein, partial [Rickettsia endosymbiont of Sericostoma sp. HW-2014]|nr:(2Fe-2S)-binding protein [Rickettsia endosymbiont of Sericostoma sp. HW-2014]
MIKLTIDDIEIEVEEGTTVFRACSKLGIEIPHFCFHERLKIAGNCR